MPTAFLKSVFGFDRKQLRAVTAIRCSLALALCLVGFWRAGHLPWGILSGLGAIYAGMASFNGIYQSRLRYMIATSILMTLLTILGTVVSQNVWAAITCVTGVGFLLSLYAAMRPAANQIATLATGTIIILSKVLQTNGDILHVALGNGLLILSGGASQILMLTLFWPFAQHFPERQAVSRVYEALADFSQRLAKGESLQMLEGDTIIDAREVLNDLDRYQLKPEQVALRKALSTAEGLRASLVGLTALSEEERSHIAAYLFFLSSTFAEISEQIMQKHILDLPPSQDLPLPRGIHEDTASALGAIKALLSHLRDPVTGEPGPRKSLSDWTHHLSLRLIALESSPSLRSIALRHAIRYALTLFVASCLARFAPFSNGYWIPLTAIIVLRTDYASTLKTGLSRGIGTVMGVLIAIPISELTPGGVPIHVALVLACTFGVYFVYRANYTIYTCLITLWVIFSISASGLSEKLVGFQRLEATLVGVLLAFVAYRLLPSWQSSRVCDVLCDAAEAQAEFCERVLLQPKLPSRSVWERELDRTRALRYEAESVIESAVREPVWKKDPSAPKVHEILLELESNAARLLGVLAQRLAGPDFPPALQSRAHQAQSKAQSLMASLQKR